MISAEKIQELKEERLFHLFPKLIHLNKSLDNSVNNPENPELSIDLANLELARTIADLITIKKPSERLAYYEYLSGRIKFFIFTERYEEAAEYRDYRAYYKHCFLQDLEGCI